MNLENRNHSVAEAIWCMMRFGTEEDGWVCNARTVERIRNVRNFANTGLWRELQFSKKLQKCWRKKAAGVKEINKMQTLKVWDDCGTKLPKKSGFYQPTYHSFQIPTCSALGSALVLRSIL